MSTCRSLLLSLLLIAGTVVAGLVVRFAHLGLPFVVVKYGGSALWALTIYWVVSAALPRSRMTAALLISGTVASAVEFFKLYHSPTLDLFRLTLPGVLLLGRFFSWWDILVYWTAITVGACVHSYLIRPPKETSALLRHP